MKIFNVDKLVPKKRVLTIDGVQHPIRTLNVDEFITNLAAAEALAEEIKKGEADLRMSTQVKESKAAIHEAVPTLSMERIGRLSIDALTAVLEFIRGDLDPNEEAPAPGAEGEQEGASAKKPD